MKAILLAAGEGRRLRPLTDTIPKCLVPVRGEPLLAWWFTLLEQHGVTEVLLNLHYRPDSVRQFLGSRRTSIAVTAVYEPQLLGSAGTVLANRRFVEGEDRFLILYADNLTNLNLTAFVKFHDDQRAALTIGVSGTDRPTEKGTVVVGPDRRVIAFEEKAPQPRSNLANAGIYAARQELFRYFPVAMPPGGVLDFGYDILPRMVPNLAAYSIEDFLMDIGTPESYERGQRLWPGLVTAAQR